MAKLRGVSRAQLNMLVRELPMPAQEHCKRCRRLASYLVENIKTEDWFLELETDPEFFVAAAYYHDIGKSSIPLDYIYSRHCKTDAQREIYKSHANAGITYVEHETGIVFGNYADRTFEKILYDAIIDHHEYYDGTGYPEGKAGRAISLAGRITAIVDTFDNLIFFKEGEEADIDASFQKAMDEIIDMSKTKFDEDLLIALIKNPSALREFTESMSGSLKKKRRSDKYGVRLEFEPIMNLSNRHGRNINGYISTMVLNDPYFGSVKPSVYMHVANQSGQIFTLDRMGLEKLCRLVSGITASGKIKLPPITFNVSYKEFEKEGFYRQLGKMFLKYGISSGQICIGVNEADIVDMHLDIERISEELHSVGALLALNDFGSEASLFSKLDTVPIDQLIVKSEYTSKMNESQKSYDIFSGMARTALKLDVAMIFQDVTLSEEEKTIIRSGAKFVCGRLYNKHPLSEKELVEFVGSQGGF